MLFLKYGSLKPHTQASARKIRTAAPTLGRHTFTYRSEKMKMRFNSVNEIHALVSVSMRCLSDSFMLHRSADAAVFSDSPKVDRHQHGCGQRNSDTVKNVESQERHATQ